MNELALFAGAGGGILGGQLLGWHTVCAVEFAPYPASVLLARQNDGLLPPFPVWDDVRTFDGNPWRGRVDVVSGGFPCQDLSVAGKGAGLSGERSGLWAHFARIIREVQPRYAFVENSPMLRSRGLGTVLGDLAAMGLDARWGVLGAADVGAPHQRDRIWIVADADRLRKSQPTWGECDQRDGTFNSRETLADTERRQQQVARFDAGMGRLKKLGAHSGPDVSPWAIEPDVGRLADGVEARMDRLAALGNGQVPQCAAAAWRLLT